MFMEVKKDCNRRLGEIEETEWMALKQSVF